MSTAVNIRPGVGMLGLFPHMKYKPWYALGELVDNAIQSYLANRDVLRTVDGSDYRLCIDIEIDRLDGGEIVVRDNAAGISAADWERAFRVADPPEDVSGLSQFGIGMKAAACWFAKEWSVRSSRVGEPLERSVEFDVPEIVRSRDESLEVLSAPVPEADHYTEIEMRALHNTPQKRTLGKIKTYLGDIYRTFLRAGEVEIRVNGEPIEYVEPPILEAAKYDAGGEVVKWRKEVEIRLESGRVVRGFAAIREKGSTSDAGLVLLYRGKVVTGVGDEKYRPEQIFGKSNSFRSQRVFGELVMDDFAVVYTKDALVWFDEEDEFIDKLRGQLDEMPLPLLKQAEGHRTRKPERDPDNKVEEVVQGTDELFPGDEIDVDSDQEEGASGPSRPEPINGEEEGEPGDEARSIVDTTFERTVGGSRWSITARLIDEPAVGHWLGVDRRDQDDVAQLKVSINKAHPFMRNFAEIPNQDLEPVWRLGIAIGLAQELARDSGGNPSDVTRNVNKLLRKYLSRPV